MIESVWDCIWVLTLLVFRHRFSELWPGLVQLMPLLVLAVFFNSLILTFWLWNVIYIRDVVTVCLRLFWHQIWEIVLCSVLICGLKLGVHLLLFLGVDPDLLLLNRLELLDEARLLLWFLWRWDLLRRSLFWTGNKGEFFILRRLSCLHCICLFHCFLRRRRILWVINKGELLFFSKLGSLPLFNRCGAPWV